MPYNVAASLDGDAVKGIFSLNELRDSGKTVWNVPPLGEKDTQDVVQKRNTLIDYLDKHFFIRIPNTEVDFFVQDFRYNLI